MTPPPATAAASSHQRTVRRGTSPRAPRRVSGPARQPKGRAVSPNQLSLDHALPARGGSVALPADSLGPRLVRGLGALAEHRWLDRLLKGRTWIVLVAIGLIGLVFMQVSLLKINSGMGAAVEKAAELERKNAGLRAAVAQLDANERLQTEAINAGMILPAAGNVTFLGSHGKRAGGDAPIVPSEADASTALLPTLPDESTEHPETAVTPIDPAAATTAEPPATTSTLDPSATAAAPTPTPTPVETAPPPVETTTPPPGATATTGGAAVPE